MKADAIVVLSRGYAASHELKIFLSPLATPRHIALLMLYFIL